MPPSATANLYFLLGSTPTIISQMVLTITLVAIGILMIGISFPRASKTKQSLLQHRWTLSVAVALTLVAVFLVMAPSAFSYLIDPSVNLLSTLSIIALFHTALGVPAATMALIYVFGDLPTNVRTWMRITATLWIATMTIGVLLFFHALALI